MNRAIDFLQAGITALKAKQFVPAEDYLLAAYKAYSDEYVLRPTKILDARLTVCYMLGRVYRCTARYEDAIDMLALQRYSRL
jgi:hypothetical protein